MIQKMQKQVEEQGVKERDLFEKFMCYCKTGVGDLKKSIADAEIKIPQLESAIKEMSGDVLQLRADLKQHEIDRTDAKKAIDEATAIRGKEAAEFAKLLSDYKINIDALGKAIDTLEKGLSGFLQTSAASYLQKLVQSDSVTDDNREMLTEFLSQGSSAQYAPSSGQIVGILKQMLDTMSSDLKMASDSERASLKEFDALVAAKTEQINVLTTMIEEKTQRVGEAGVKVVEMAEDLDDTKAHLVADQQFLVDLEKGCATKEAEWSERCKTRSEELNALAETIKILNDDDALELFKKTLHGSASFIQVSASNKELVAHASSILLAFRHHKKDYRVNAILLGLQGKSYDFSKIIAYCDSMVALLEAEQKNDDAQLEQCKTDLDLAEDKQKELDRTAMLLQKRIDDSSAAIVTLFDEIHALVEGVIALDIEVAERTEIRQEENSDYIAEMSQHKAAHELIIFAKNRMNKFYNPKLYHAPPPSDTVVVGLVQTHKVAPPPPPETWAAYSKASEGGNGVIAMMDVLINDVATEMTEMEENEKHAQEDYVQFMADAAEKRMQDSKSITDKSAVKADAATDFQEAKSDHKNTVAQLMANDKAINALHAMCDWLVQYYDVRKEARDGEIMSVKNAKAVLSGANFS